MSKHFLACTLVLTFSLGVIPLFPTLGRAADNANALDPTLKPEEVEEISNVYKDMGVVQRKAMAKSGKFLFSAYGSFDFSDGPYTNYSLSFNPGYALSDYWEVYLNIAPVFIVAPRAIVTKIQTLTLANGQTATITASTPQLQFGGELLWAPAYGKDSLGISHVIRSDTFFKLGVASVSLLKEDKVTTDSGMRFVLGVGKTFFLSNNVGFRFCINYGQLQDIVQGTKAFRSVFLLETGINLYLF